MPENFSIAMQVLETWGATVVQLPTSAKEECDWLAQLDGCRLIVEEKIKFDDPTQITAREEAFLEGQSYNSSHPLGSNNRISAIVKKAAGQLSSTAADLAHDLRILWFTGLGFDAEVKHRQLISTLYGSTKVFQANDNRMRTCYFFRNSDFFRFRDQLDGAVAAYVNGSTATLKLCLNPYSPRCDGLRDSPFARKFVHGLVDPIAQESAGDAYIVDGDVDRRDERAILSYLEEKYELERAMNMDMNMASVAMPMSHR